MEFFADDYPIPTAEFLKPTEFLDFDHPEVRRFAEETAGGGASDVEKAVRLFYEVRDTIRYDPYRVSTDPATYRASHLLATRAGFCLPKANLLAASARALGIPAGIGLSDVVNHLCTQRLRDLMGGNDVFIHHGYVVFYLESRWVKAVPAFNIDLCRRFRVQPTEFDGRSDAMFQQFDADGRKHMEYLRHHGMWSDFPYDRVINDFLAYYPPSLFQDPEQRRPAAFEQESPLV